MSRPKFRKAGGVAGLPRYYLTISDRLDILPWVLLLDSRTRLAASPDVAEGADTRSRRLVERQR